jgi:hypothetical protein
MRRARGAASFAHPLRAELLTRRPGAALTGEIVEPVGASVLRTQTMTVSPAARRAAVMNLLAAHGRALHINEIATRLDLPAGAYVALQRLLDDLSFDGALLQVTTTAA